MLVHSPFTTARARRSLRERGKFPFDQLEHLRLRIDCAAYLVEPELHILAADAMSSPIKMALASSPKQATRAPAAGPRPLRGQSPLSRSPRSRRQSVEVACVRRALSEALWTVDHSVMVRIRSDPRDLRVQDHGREHQAHC